MPIVDDPYPAVCDYEGSDYQGSFWERGGRAYEDGAEAIALRRLLPPSGGRMLEIGAGAGRNTLRYVGFREITLLDYSRSQLAQARRRLGDSDRFRYVLADVYRMPFGPASFDGATMIRTLHHLPDPARALGMIRESLVSGAVFILEYANKRNLKAMARWLLRRQAWSPFDRAPVEFARLNYDFHPAAIRSWLAGAGFHVEREVPVSHLRIGWLKRAVPTGVLLGFEGGLQRLGRAWLVTPSVFVRARAAGETARAASFAWRCPGCGSLTLIESDTGLTCGGCGSTWAKQDGIYDFRRPVAGG
jgi:SAM-dependent methyltransferase